MVDAVVDVVDVLDVAAFFDVDFDVVNLVDGYFLNRWCEAHGFVVVPKTIL